MYAESQDGRSWLGDDGKTYSLAGLRRVTARGTAVYAVTLAGGVPELEVYVERAGEVLESLGAEWTQSPKRIQRDMLRVIFEWVSFSSSVRVVHEHVLAMSSVGWKQWTRPGRALAGASRAEEIVL